MYFYRPLNQIKALSFDLDDTLYDNILCMQQAEEAHIAALCQIDGLQNMTIDKFKTIKQKILLDNPEIYHDVVAWRRATLQWLLESHNISKSNSLVDEVMAQFILWRHKITVPQTSLDLLAELSKHYPLVVISNGNVEIKRIGLDGYFQFSLRGGIDGRSKPFPEIFQKAANKLNVPIKQILHIGDNLYTDVLGAINSGMQACWLNCSGQTLRHQGEARVLPNIEISHLSQLTGLLTHK